MLSGQASVTTTTVGLNMPTDEPAWLAAWRGGDAPAAPAQPGHQRESQGAGRGSGTSTAASPTAAAEQRFSAGFSEPTPWRFDQCKRREPMLDMDRNPPMPIRYVGWRICITCVRPFWSEHVVSVRMCAGCKSTPETAKPLRL